MPLFPKTAHILRSAEFRKVYDKGVRYSGPLFAAFCLQRQFPATEAGPEGVGSAGSIHGLRLGLTVPRAIGNAVERNRIKRRLREAFRLHREESAGNWDIVLNPRRAMLNVEFSEIETALGKVITRCK